MQHCRLYQKAVKLNRYSKRGENMFDEIKILSDKLYSEFIEEVHGNLDLIEEQKELKFFLWMNKCKIIALWQIILLQVFK